MTEVTDANAAEELGQRLQLGDREWVGDALGRGRGAEQRSRDAGRERDDHQPDHGPPAARDQVPIREDQRDADQGERDRDHEDRSAEHRGDDRPGPHRVRGRPRRTVDIAAIGERQERPGREEHGSDAVARRPDDEQEPDQHERRRRGTEDELAGHVRVRSDDRDQHEDAERGDRDGRRDGGPSRSSAARGSVRPQPQDGGRRFDGSRGDHREIIDEGREVQLVPESGGELLDHLVRVVPGPVEATVHGPLDPRPQRVEERRDEKRRCRHRDAPRC